MRDCGADDVQSDVRFAGKACSNAWYKRLALETVSKNSPRIPLNALDFAPRKTEGWSKSIRFCALRRSRCGNSGVVERIRCKINPWLKPC